MKKIVSIILASILVLSLCACNTVSKEDGQIGTKIGNTLIIADGHYTSDGNPGRDEHYTGSGSGIMPDAEHFVAAPDGYIAGKGDFRRVHAF